MPRKTPKATDVPVESSPSGLLGAMVNACEPERLTISEPTRLVEIAVARYSVVAAQVWHTDHTPRVHHITLTEDGARKLMHDLVRGLL